MATKPKSTTRLQLLQQLTNAIVAQISCLEEELAAVAVAQTSSDPQQISQEELVQNEVASIRRGIEILNLKQKYLTRVNHRLKHRIKDLNHHC